jgi:hypothetical protein
MVCDAYAKADVGHFCNPLWLVVADGLEIRPIVLGERLPQPLRRGRFYYQWDADPREEGAGVYLRFAARLLLRCAHNASDECLLAGELAIPEICARALRAPEIVARHAFAPVSWIEARVHTILSGSGVFYKPPELVN